MKTRFGAVLTILFLSLILVAAIFGLGDALLPLILASIIAYFIFPIIVKLENKGIHRNVAISGTLVGVILVALGIGALAIPPLVEDARSFAQALPDQVTEATHRINALASDFGVELDLDSLGLSEIANEISTQFSFDTIRGTTKFMKNAFSSVSNFFVSFLNILMIPLFLFFILGQFENLKTGLKSLIPIRYYPKAIQLAEMANTALKGYIRGQFSVALILAVLYATGLALAGINFGILIGVIAGLLGIIPYFGFALGVGLSILVTLASPHSFGDFFAIGVVFSAVQALESFVITPKIVGDKVGLNALETMLVLIIGGNLLGLAGMLLAIPTGAITKKIIGAIKDDYQSTAFYRGNT